MEFVQPFLLMMLCSCLKMHGFSHVSNTVRECKISETVGQTGDIFLSEHFGAVFWKKPYQEGGGKRWMVAFDRDLVIHPCEPDLRLIVQKDWQGKQYILWERLWVQTEGSFEDALTDMKESVLMGNATGTGTAACLMEVD